MWSVKNKNWVFNFKFKKYNKFWGAIENKNWGLYSKNRLYEI